MKNRRWQPIRMAVFIVVLCLAPYSSSADVTGITPTPTVPATTSPELLEHKVFLPIVER